MWTADPWYRELWSERDNHQDPQRRHAVHEQIERLARGWVAPVYVLVHHQHGLSRSQCFDLLHLLRAEASRHAEGGSSERARLDAALYETLTLTSDVQRSIDADARADRMRLQRLGATLTGALNGSFDLDHVETTLRSTLPALGIHSVHVGVHPGSHDTSQLRTAFAFDTTTGPLALDDQSYPSHQLVGEGVRSVLEGRSHVVMPLVHGPLRLGLGVFEFAPIDGYNYLLVAMLLGTMLAANAQR